MNHEEIKKMLTSGVPMALEPTYLTEFPNVVFFPIDLPLLGEKMPKLLDYKEACVNHPEFGLSKEDDLIPGPKLKTRVLDLMESALWGQTTPGLWCVSMRYHQKAMNLENKWVRMSKIEYGPDFISLPALIDCAVRRVKNAKNRQFRSTVQYEVATVFAITLLDPLEQNGHSFRLSDAHTSNHDVQPDIFVHHVHVGIFDSRILGALDNEESTQSDYLALLLTYGTGDAIKKLQCYLTQAYRVLMDGVHGLQLGWRFLLDAEISDYFAVTAVERNVGGAPRAPFSEKLVHLTRDDVPDMARHQARQWQIIGHIITLVSEKVRGLPTITDGRAVGIATDGVTIGGKKYEQIRVRGRFFGGEHPCTITLPPVKMKTFKKKDVQLNIRRHMNVHRDPAAYSKQIKATVAQGTLMAKVEDLLIGERLFNDVRASMTIDKGSEQRAYYLRMLRRGYKIVIRFDAQHGESR
ncbi:unnamed protein product, partial [Amoebophrya sp. A25]|eukprot:GSA25T00008176001.1